MTETEQAVYILIALFSALLVVAALPVKAISSFIYKIQTQLQKDNKNPTDPALPSPTKATNSSIEHKSFISFMHTRTVRDSVARIAAKNDLHPISHEDLIAQVLILRRELRQVRNHVYLQTRQFHVGTEPLFLRPPVRVPGEHTSIVRSREIGAINLDSYRQTNPPPQNSPPPQETSNRSQIN